MENKEFLKIRNIVYGILCLENNRIYIGSSKMDGNGIFNTHQKKLRNNKKQDNKRLQKDFNEFGYEKFIFGILEIIEINDNEYTELNTLEERISKKLLDREQYYIDIYYSYIPYFGYNISKKSNKLIKYNGSINYDLFKDKVYKEHNFLAIKKFKYIDEETRKKFIESSTGRKQKDEIKNTRKNTIKLRNIKKVKNNYF